MQAEIDALKSQLEEALTEIERQKGRRVEDRQSFDAAVTKLKDDFARQYALQHDSQGSVESEVANALLQLRGTLLNDARTRSTDQVIMTSSQNAIRDFNGTEDAEGSDAWIRELDLMKTLNQWSDATTYNVAKAHFKNAALKWFLTRMDTVTDYESLKRAFKSTFTKRLSKSDRLRIMSKRTQKKEEKIQFDSLVNDSCDKIVPFKRALKQMVRNRIIYSVILRAVRPKVVKRVQLSKATQTASERAYSDSTSFDAFPATSVYPTQEDDGNPLEIEYGLSTYQNHQTLTIQEMPEKAPAGQLPRTIEIILDNDLVHLCKPDDRVQVIGNYRCVPGNKGGYTSGAFRELLHECRGIHRSEDLAEILQYQWDLLPSYNLRNKRREEIINFWMHVRSIQDANGDFVFKQLSEFCIHVLSIPHSNVFPERRFSEMNNRKTKLKNKMSIDTMNAAIHTGQLVKMSGDDYEPSQDVIEQVARGRFYDNKYKDV
ncbi:hypothetical protein TKK_0000764 [Trichogramma kaykai]